MSEEPPIIMNQHTSDDTLTSESTSSESSMDEVGSGKAHTSSLEDKDPQRVCTSSFHKYSLGHVNRQYLEIRKLVKNTVKSEKHVPSDVMLLMELILVWKQIDDFDLSKLEYETTQILGNSYISSDDDNNIFGEEVQFFLLENKIAILCSSIECTNLLKLIIHI